MAIINHENILPLEDLAELARECGEEIEDPETDAEDRSESLETLKQLSNLAAHLGRVSDETDAESVADALDSASGDYSSSGLIAADHWEDYAKQLVEDLGMVPRDLNDVISSNIDWEGVAEDLLVDYTSITLDGSDYYIR